jgi:hypothetical protein
LPFVENFGFIAGVDQSLLTANELAAVTIPATFSLGLDVINRREVAVATAAAKHDHNWATADVDALLDRIGTLLANGMSSIGALTPAHYTAVAASLPRSPGADMFKSPEVCAKVFKFLVKKRNLVTRAIQLEGINWNPATCRVDGTTEVWEGVRQVIEKRPPAVVRWVYLPTFDKINALFASPTHDESRAKTALALSGAATKHHFSTSTVIGETEKKGVKTHDPIKSKGKRRARSVDGDSEAFEATPVPAAKRRKIKTEEDNDDGAVAAGSSASSTSDASKVNGKCRMSSCCSRFLCRMTVSRLSRPRDRDPPGPTTCGMRSSRRWRRSVSRVSRRLSRHAKPCSGSSSLAC